MAGVLSSCWKSKVTGDRPGPPDTASQAWPRQTPDSAAAPAARARHKKQISQFVRMLLTGDDERLFGAFCVELRQKFLICYPKVRWHEMNWKEKGSAVKIFDTSQTFIFEGKPGPETAVVEQCCGGQMCPSSRRPGPGIAVSSSPDPQSI